MKNIVIIGNGISGITAARHIRKLSDNNITVISAESNHFYSRTALMYIYMGHMKYEHTKPYEDWFWEKNRINLKRAYVKSVDTDNKTLHFNDGESMDYDILIIATGSKSNKFGWEGQHLKGVQGLYNLQDLESMEANTKNINRAVVVGGGLIGIEMVEMLLSRKIPVTFLVREDSFWNNVLPEGESAMINRHIYEHHVDLQLGTELDKIHNDGKGGVESVVTKDGEVIHCQFVGLTVGVTPNIGFLEDSKIETDRGVLVDEFLQTNIPDVYALGDCVQHKTPLGERKNIEQVWYTGKMMGEAVAYTICKKPTKYQPGTWFNSAKFLDIEYQTYGWVWPQPKENEEHFYWEHPNGKKCIRINYNKTDKTIIGINTFGIRLRQNVCVRWIEEQRTIDYALEHMRNANFEPEFYESFEPALIEAYNLQTGSNLKPKRKNWTSILKF